MKRYETGSAIRGAAVLLLLLVALAVGGLLAGCSRGGSGGGRDYTVRGKVTQLPESGDPENGLAVSHQAIDDFVDREGKVVGMNPMTMSFPLGPRVPLAGLAVGDPLEFTLHVDWSATPPIRITSLHKLPPGTPIDYRVAQPPEKKP